VGFQISVDVFKPSGKWGYSEKSKLSDCHKYIMGFDLERLIRNNAGEVWHYSPLGGGFKAGYIYVVQVEYPPEVNNWCFRLIDKTGENDA